MEVIPAINCNDFECVVEQVATAERSVLAGGWVHIDVTDGKFTFNKTWNSPEEFKTVKEDHPRLHFEIHLMVEDPDRVVESWLEAGAERVIVHLESLLHFRNLSDHTRAIAGILEKCREYNAKAMLAISVETPVEDLVPYADKFSFFQILAVQAGLPGQVFFPIAAEKVRALRAVLPNATIEVDGGINLETAKLVKDAGADIIVSASYIMNSDDPRLTYELLKKL